MTNRRVLRAVLAMSCAIAANAATPARADDWARFRGPNGAGVAEGTVPADLSDKDFAWKVDLPGKGHCSPAVYKDRVYLTSADPDTGTRYVICLNAKDGLPAWTAEYKFAKFRQHADNSFASATPAVDETGVYVAWCTPEKYTLVALGLDGKERWTKDLGRFTSVQGQGTSPVVVDDVVVLANDQEGPKSAIVGYDRNTGAVRWTLDRKTSDKTSMSTPVVVKGIDGASLAVFTSKSSGMTAVDAKTGKVAWEVPDAFDARTVGSPVVAGDLVLGTSGEGGQQRLLVAVKPPKSAAEQATVAYKIKGVAPYVPTALVKGDRLYMWGDAGTVTCAKVSTGEQVWSEKVGGAYYGSPVCVGDTIWCLSKKGELVGIKAADTFEKVAKVELGEASHSTPAVADGRMYLRTVSKLVCVKVGK